jgi:hypothetical protein
MGDGCRHRARERRFDNDVALQHQLSILPQHMHPGQCAQLGRVSADEEFYQHWRKHVVSRAVVLTFQVAALPVWEDSGEFVCRVTQKHMIFAAAQEHRCIGYLGHPFEKEIP